MDRQESDNTWAPEEVALPEAGGDAAAGTSLASSDHGTAISQPEVLARLPDLDTLQPSWEMGTKPSRGDGRFLSQGVSTKLLVGACVLLVCMAVLPFILKGDDPKPGTPPAPDAAEAPIWKGQAGEPSQRQPAPASLPYEPNMSFNADLPPAPDFIGVAQEAGTEASTQTVPAQPERQTGATIEQGQAAPVDRQSQLDTFGPRARANRTMVMGNPVNGNPTPPPAGIYGNDYRRFYQADSRANLPTRHSAESFSDRAAEPGVARLEGIIEKPSVRTSYDAGRSSVH